MPLSSFNFYIIPWICHFISGNGANQQQTSIADFVPIACSIYCRSAAEIRGCLAGESNTKNTHRINHKQPATPATCNTLCNCLSNNIHLFLKMNTLKHKHAHYLSTTHNVHICTNIEQMCIRPEME